MHAFESLVAEILEEDYWVRRNFKVELSREEKKTIGRPSSPRWELDLVAYSPSMNQLLVVECKSYLDSTGVNLDDIQGGRYAERYKLFTEETLRKVILNKLSAMMINKGLCSKNPEVRLALAAGKINGKEKALEQYFAQNGWSFFGPSWLNKKLRNLSEGSYTNSVATMVTKLLLRGRADED